MPETDRPHIEIDANADETEQQQLAALDQIINEAPALAAQILQRGFPTYDSIVGAAASMQGEAYPTRLLKTLASAWASRADGALGFDRQTERELNSKMPNVPAQRRHWRIAGYAGQLAVWDSDHRQADAESGSA